MKELDPFADRPEEVLPSQSTPDFSELQGADSPDSYVNSQVAGEASGSQTHAWGADVNGEFGPEAAKPGATDRGAQIEAEGLDEKSAEQSPERYWGDVNRYCGEILAGLPVEADDRKLLPREWTVYRWPAQEEGVEAALHKLKHRILGHFTVTHYYLGLRRTVFDTTMIHFISFRPDGNAIESVHDDIRPATGEMTLREQIKKLWEKNKMAKQVGVTVPTEDDYGLLWNELRRGAQFRSFDVDENY